MAVAALLSGSMVTVIRLPSGRSVVPCRVGVPERALAGLVMVICGAWVSKAWVAVPAAVGRLPTMLRAASVATSTWMVPLAVPAVGVTTRV